LPEGTNKERNEKEIEICSIHKKDFKTTIFGSFIFKDRIKKRRRKINDNIRNDFIMIIKVTAIL
tara:strand:+ start:245 stop:436 length:192 start_codon:yes stop_codon:yes gene_type:complete